MQRKIKTKFQTPARIMTNKITDWCQIIKKKKETKNCP